MTLTKKIPKAALGVLRIIRKEVPRPKELPVGLEVADRRELRFKRQGYKCPMGFIPGTNESAPCASSDFPDRRIGNKGIERFAHWWDEQDDARAAMDAVWPKKKSRVAKKK